MGTFKYIMCWILVAALSVIPLIDPVRSSILSAGEAVLLDTGMLVITFSSSLIPQMISIGVMLFGSFIIYCIYKGNECTWRKEKMKGDFFVPDTFTE